MVLGSLLFGLRSVAAVCDAVQLWFASYYCVDKCFCAPLRVRDSLSMSIETGGCEAAPYDFLRSAPAPRGPTELSPERLRRGGTGPATGPSHGQNRRCKGCIKRCRAHRCPSGAQGPRDRSLIECCETLHSEACADSTSSHAATLPCSAALHFSKRPRPEGRQHLPNTLSEKSRRLRVPRGRHGGALLR